jgi:hypothetical protein
VEPLAYREVLDRRVFLRDHLKPRKPVVLVGALERWYAADVWSFEWFGNAYGDLLVELRFPTGPGSDANVGYERRSDTVGAYVKRLLEGQPVRECGYLASLPLLPSLKQIAVFPDYLWLDRLSGAAAWLGPAGTESVLHCDLLDNLFAQVKGRKLFQLYLPRSIDSSGPRQYNSLLAHPRHRESPPEPDYEFVLEERELLYVPPFHWHRVIGLEPSISVSQVWYTLRTFGRDLPRVLSSLTRRVAGKLRAIAKTGR